MTTGGNTGSCRCTGTVLVGLGQRAHLARSPRLERVLVRSMMGLLFRTDLLARDRSAVTRVIEILQEEEKKEVQCEPAAGSVV